MRDYFEKICQLIDAHKDNDSFYLVNLNAEDSDFVRFNQGKIRQPSSVQQANLQITWIRDGKQLHHNLSLSRNLDQDSKAITQAITQMKADLNIVEVDPHLVYQTDIINSDITAAVTRNDAHHICHDILNAALNHDMVGLLSVGTQYVAFANANGQRNWYSFDDVNLDWSIYTGADKASKGQWATQAWDQQQFMQAFDKTIAEAELLKRPAKELRRGEYRVYLAPTALADIVTFTDFGYKRWHNKSSRLQRWFDGRAALSPKLTLKQNPTLGLAANFQQQGYVNQPLTLVAEGQPAEKFISPRSGIEFGVAHNGADNGESFTSLEVAAGELEQENILTQLDTGIYINNLHYLNVSDLSAARLTGMTRFACFWVEDGKKIAPIGVMRFDDSIYRLLGSELEALTVQRERIVSDSTYYHRGRGGMLLPGALSSMTFTL